jgi:hypothetical protein
VVSPLSQLTLPFRLVTDRALAVQAIQPSDATRQMITVGDTYMGLPISDNNFVDACVKHKTYRSLGKKIRFFSSKDTVLFPKRYASFSPPVLRFFVRFGDFGSFQISLGGSGSETKEQYTHALIQSKKVVFRPGIDLKDMLATLKFEK